MSGFKSIDVGPNIICQSYISFYGAWHQRCAMKCNNIMFVSVMNFFCYSTCNNCFENSNSRSKLGKLMTGIAHEFG